ncbi:hypothetical protein COV94_06010, partial [Candidatus Woesearchaeota archaeon CG11_big_fil_rev_8_21_14_0_20_57_5]
EALTELRQSLWAMALANTAVDALLVASGAYLATVVAGLPPWIALAVALGYFPQRLRQERAGMSYQAVEAKTVRLRERLSTAVDNLSRENFVAKELRSDVTKDMRGIQTGDFLDTRRVMVKSSIMIVLLLCSIVYSSFSLSIADALAPIMAKARGAHTFKGLYDTSGNVSFEQGDEDIFGESSMAKLSGKSISLELAPMATAVDITQLNPEQAKRFTSTEIPQVEASADGAYRSSIPADQEETVRKYFDLIEQV